ncbi:DUF4288 domain-containing protein [Xanthocytophaga agilis]|uniref:DUF4288 domain-containing protein n=1 Tax=Xanthocytophaga agilis TaxID=3048010 RepID=A0AAE3RB04_9BACT|nr:DUF4288 domain-containing protein [Xanthocytophaga agilis]MDJ1504038.1 DUF4288 domain-containing protein [Xanthocytophaga agilis]
MKKEDMKWYGVKLVYVFTIQGLPIVELIDKNYIENYRGYEESIVIIKAQSFDEAYELAEKVARKNESDHTNIYGQRVEKRYLESLDCFWIFEERIKSGMEVYSQMIDSTTQVETEDFLDTTFPMNSLSGQHSMLLNVEFSGRKEIVDKYTSFEKHTTSEDPQ